MSEQQPIALRGGTIVDGTGAAPFRGDILIDHGRIVDIGDIDIPLGTQQVDVDDHVVAPGFIDMHSHSDLALLSEPELTIKVRQGITTEVIGQDGISYAPASERGLTQARELFAPVNGDGDRLDWSWRSVHDFLER
jgi:N-acyl-D-amino-acid deacylase